MPRAIITKKTPSPTMTQTPGGVFTLRSLSPDRVLEVALFQSRLAMRPPHFTRFRSVLQMQFQFRAPTSPYLFPKHIRYLCDRNPVLLHRVAIADGDGILIGRPVLADRIKVHRYAERCPPLRLVFDSAGRSRRLRHRTPSFPGARNRQCLAPAGRVSRCFSEAGKPRT